jgi:titin
LTWTDNSAAEDGYEVRRSDPTTSWTVIATLPANSVTYRDATVAVDISYRYAVRAIKDGGFSQTSNEVSSVISTTVPAAPQGAAAYFTADDGGYGFLYFTVVWLDASSNEQGFRIEYSPDGVSGWTTYGTADIDATYFFEQYSVFSGYGAPVGCYRVVAFNSLGDSPPSNASCVDYYGPTDLVATPVDQQEIDLAWSDNATFETVYYVARASAIDDYYSVIASLPANSTSYRDTGLSAGQEYWYVVIAGYDGGQELWSNTAGAVTGSAAAAGIRVLPGGIGNRGVTARPPKIKGLPPRAPAHPSPHRVR